MLCIYRKPENNLEEKVVKVTLDTIRSQLEAGIKYYFLNSHNSLTLRTHLSCL